MPGIETYLGRILHGDCLELLPQLPAASVDLIFADPPYNLQLKGELWRPNMTRVNGVQDDWDRFASFEAYDEFSRAWLGACRRVLKDDGTIWVIGTYHNIYRLGAILQDLGYWILNDVLWIKSNPMPNFRGVRFTNAHETLIWASKSRGARYTFNHHAMKALNEGKQMRSDWTLPICSGAERLKSNGEKAHSTQKPEDLLRRVILASSNPGDVVLDPFFGSGTTGAVAKRLRRRWIGIERQAGYVDLARRRIEDIEPEADERLVSHPRDRRRRAARIPFTKLLEHEYLKPGQTLFFRGKRDLPARIGRDGKLRIGDFEGSIHQAGRHLMNGSPCNGWKHWYYQAEDGELAPIDVLRQRLRARSQNEGEA
jgi:site-specific DNA-methyltransferase (adenine-specific)